MALVEAMEATTSAVGLGEALAPHQQAQRDERTAWLHGMRAKFSPPNLVSADGSLNQNFFKPERVVFVSGKRWGTEEKDRLYQGLEKHGVGKWREISEELLPQWDDQSLRVKAARLFGSQSLARYVGWKGPRSAVEAEFEKNKVLGESIGCWRGGVLVENDANDVAKALAEQTQTQNAPYQAGMEK